MTESLEQKLYAAYLAHNGQDPSQDPEIWSWGIDSIDSERKSFRVHFTFHDNSFTAFEMLFSLNDNGSVTIEEPEPDYEPEYDGDNFYDDFPSDQEYGDWHHRYDDHGDW